MKNEGKHDHKLTKLLKFSIFATLMLAPFIAIGGQIAYTTFNKNAKDSYSVKYSETTKALNSGNVNDLYVNGQIVNIKWNNSTYGTRSGIYGYSNIDVDVNQLLNTTNVNYIGFSFYTSNATWMYFIDDTNVEHQLNNYKTVLENGFSYTVDINTYTQKQIYNYALATITTTISAPLDNAFYDAVDKVQESDLFNWTQNTAIYNGINGMTSGLGIQTQAIPILLTYWIILTAVYIVFDIVIECFIWLTHIFNPSKLA